MIKTKGCVYDGLYDDGGDESYHANLIEGARGGVYEWRSSQRRSSMT